MSLDVRVEVAAREHRSALQQFECCAPHVIRPGGGGRRDCLEPWSHDVQVHIRTGALSRTSSPAGQAVDHRLLLLWDGDELVAVGAHERREGVPPRSVEFLAVLTSLRGASLSDGQRCSDAALAMVLGDIARRQPRTTHASAAVRTDNERSARLLQRHGGLVDDEVVQGCRAVLLPCPGADPAGRASAR